MRTILIVDEMAIVREPISKALEAAGYKTECAASSHDAIMKLLTVRPDLVLLDLLMPTTSGLRVLQVIRENAASANTHVIVLTASCDRSMMLECARLGVRHYLLKSRFDIRDLLARVAQCLQVYERLSTGSQARCAQPPGVARAPGAGGPSGCANGSVAASSTSHVARIAAEETHRRIARAEVKALPGAVADLISLTTSARASVADVAACLKRDPPLASRLLRVANSAAYASKKLRITTIEDAIKHVGLSEVNRLATCIGILESFGGGANSQRFIRNWQHSLGVAALMERFCGGDEQMPPAGLAHTVGLCRGLPAIMMHQLFEKEEHAIEEVARTSARYLGACYEDVIGITHDKLAIALLERAGLPVIVFAPLKEFFATTAARGSPQRSELCRMLRIASGFASGLMLGPTGLDAVTPFERSACQLGGARKEIEQMDAAELRTQVALHAGATAGLTSEQVAALSESLIAVRSLRLTYLRDPAFSAFDPLHALFSLAVSDLTVHTEPTETSASLENSDALIVARAVAGSDFGHEATDVAKGRGIATLVLSAPTALDTKGAKDNQECALPTSADAIDQFLSAAGKSTARKAA